MLKTFEPGSVISTDTGSDHNRLRRATMAKQFYRQYVRSSKFSILEKLDLYSIPEPNSGCRLWIGACDTCGYGSMFMPNGIIRKAHRVSWEEHNGPIPAGMEVCHKCDVPCCVNDEHLFLGSHSDNMQDMIAKGRGYTGDVKGTNHGMARLTEDLVLRIRAARLPQKIIAAEFGITQSMVSNIRLRKNWSHIPASPDDPPSNMKFGRVGR